MTLPETGRSRNRVRKHRARGFTLTELLVTVAVIAILCALVGPALIGAGHKARQTRLNAQMGLGEHHNDDPDHPGTISFGYSEEAARSLYRRWANMLAHEKWADIRSATDVA